MDALNTYMNGLSKQEQDYIRSWDQNDWPMARAWVLWSRGKKFKGGPIGKLTAQLGFVAGYACAKGIDPEKTDSPADSGESADHSGVRPGPDHAADVGGVPDPL